MALVGGVLYARDLLYAQATSPPFSLRWRW